MSHDDDRPGDDGVYDEPPVDPHPSVLARRARLAAGAVGLAAVLGAGAYTVTTWYLQRTGTTIEEPAAVAPLVRHSPSASASAVSSPSPSSNEGAKAGKVQAVEPTPSRTKSVEEQIREAREKAAKEGYPPAGPLVPKQGLPTGKVETTDEGSLDEGRTVRYVTADHDLTGQRELLWAADRGEKVGDGHCTQNFHFSNNREPKIRPTMMMCWRTSATKSVVAIAVVKEGRPKAAETIELLDRKWAQLR
ncbi:hypothetical protein [Actinoplanes sp. NPDC051851]|uniref:hypothetical protein n=1 Tax=Actinoplanes sp. NPDC051851 TaxID=3154753 RepID=UPI00342B96F6